MISDCSISLPSINGRRMRMMLGNVSNADIISSYIWKRYIINIGYIMFICASACHIENQPTTPRYKTSSMMDETEISFEFPLVSVKEEEYTEELWEDITKSCHPDIQRVIKECVDLEETLETLQDKIAKLQQSFSRSQTGKEAVSWMSQLIHYKREIKKIRKQLKHNTDYIIKQHRLSVGTPV